MKFKSICLSSMLIYGLYAGTAYPEAVLTSKAYVDNKVPAYNSATESQSLLTDTTTTGTIAKRAIYSDTAANYDSTTQSTQIPTMGAVMSAISSATPTLPTGTNGNIVTYNAQGQIGGSLDPATFQPAITTGLANWDYGDGTVTPTFDALVSYDTTNGVVGNKIGVYDTTIAGLPLDSILDTDNIYNYYMTGNNRALLRNTVPNLYSLLPVLRGKQNNIPAHASGAADSLLTDSETDGTVQKRAIFNDTAANYDSTTQSTQIPTMGAVMSAVSAGTNAVDVSSHTVNGAPLSNSASYFYGTSSTAAATAQKEVSIPSITSLAAGQIIVVQPTVDSSVANSTIKLNDFAAYPMRYNNAAITTSTDATVWNSKYPSIWVFDGEYWVFAGRGYDANSTYATMSVSEGTTGTATTARSMRADYLKQIIQGTKLTGLDTTDATAVVATDSITTGIGKLQAQITDVTGDIPTLPTGTADSLVTYGANGTFGERGVEATALGTSTSATTVPTTGVVVSAFNTKFPANNGSSYPDGSLVAYGRFDGVPDTRKIVTTVAQSGRDIPTDGAVFSAVAGKANKPTCTLTKPGDSSICYAWTFADVGASCAAYDESVSSASECCSGVTYEYSSGKIAYPRCGCAIASDCSSGTCNITTHKCS